MTRLSRSTSLAAVAAALLTIAPAPARGAGAPAAPSPFHFYLAPGVLAGSGVGVSAEAGLEVYGLLARISGMAAAGSRSFSGKELMLGYALGLGALAPYAGLGWGSISWTPHAEFLEPQYSIHADTQVLCPEVGVILGHDEPFGRGMLGLQLLIPSSTSLSSGVSLPAGFQPDGSPWIFLTMRVSI